MSISFNAQVKVSPSFSEPDFILTYAQPSGAYALLENSQPRVKLGNTDLNVYINTVDIRSERLASQFTPSFLPSASLVGDYIQTQTYQVQVRADYGPDDTASAANYAIGLPQALQFANRQGIFQGLRSMLLYGLNAQNGEGLLNAPGVTSITLPPDSYGNDTVMTYDNGQMAIWLANQVVSLVSGMYQTSPQKGRVVFVGPQRVLLQWQLADVVQITTYQRLGGGSNTTLGTLGTIMKDAGYDAEWHYDDTLIGKGAGGTDAVIVAMPEIETPDIPAFNTNEFGQLQPHLNAVNLQYLDMAAPMTITTPIPDGALTVLDRFRATCGWCVRPQGTYILNLPYGA